MRRSARCGEASYEGDSSTSRLSSVSVTRNVSLGRLSVEEAEEPPLPDEEAVAIWQRLDDGGHKRLVERYLKEAENFRNLRDLDRGPRHPPFSIL
jgi:hypothetical protein